MMCDGFVCALVLQVKLPGKVVVPWQWIQSLPPIGRAKWDGPRLESGQLWHCMHYLEERASCR